jgi:hypothetical protein
MRLLPVHLLGQGKRLPARVGALMQDAGWFRGSTARLRTPVSVVVESVDVAGPPAGAVCDWIGRLDQPVVTDLSPVSATDAGPPDIEQRPIDHLWGRPVDICEVKRPRRSPAARLRGTVGRLEVRDRAGADRRSMTPPPAAHFQIRRLSRGPPPAGRSTLSDLAGMIPVEE